MPLLTALTEVDLETFTHFVYIWGGLGILTPIAVAMIRGIPISNRYELTGALAILGTIDKKLGWMIMEIPILIVVSYFYFFGSLPLNVSAVMFGAFFLHYVNRGLIFPHRIQVQGKRMPLLSMLASVVFYTVNGWVIGHYFGSLRAYPAAWLVDPRFLIGALLFVTGAVVNIRSDNILIRLREPGETEYKIPYGGLFEHVSCPNFFGEIVEWIGFAIMTWSLPGALYAAWVGLTLFTTALKTHRWYRERFDEDYPADRKAVIPFVI